MFRRAIWLLLPVCAMAQQLVNSFSVDTTQYSSDYVGATWGPSQSSSSFPFALKKKGTGQADIFSILGGKLATIDLPSLPPSCISPQYFASQTYFDSDSGWEGIVNYYDTVGWANGTKIVWQFRAFDETGAILLSDYGYATLIFDGQNTYIGAGVYSGRTYMSPTIKAWRLRSNVQSSAPAVQKQVENSSPRLTSGPQGPLRLSLATPSTGGVTVRLFDLLGQTIYSQTEPAGVSSSAFLIPSIGTPHSPYISVVSTDHGSFTQKSVPVR
ncbi:MAG: T9SS type A sorting domain-containing protein [Armatimonadetes bacterium]|nr:T9SS type A sorting domain-containing protein [Armatimonadota bacterium]